MRPQSLRGVFLLWLVVPLICLWLASSLAALAVSRHLAGAMYDEELLDTARAIDLYARSKSDSELNENTAGVAALLFDSVDQLRYGIVNDKGQVVAGTQDVPRPSDLPAADAPTYFDAVADGQFMRWVAMANTRRPEGARTWVIVGETRRKREIAADQALAYVAAPQLALAIALAVLVWFGIGRGLRPLRDLQRRLRARSASDLRPLMLMNSPTEVQAVADDINVLFRRLSEVLAQQSAFIGDAAHQLRTPLAALKASVAYALRHRETERAAVSLEQVAATADRCIRTVNQLLTLARADAAQSGGMPLQRIDARAACEEIVMDRVNAALSRGIDLGVEGSDVSVLADATLLREALGNLIDNAIRYAKPGGQVTVGAAVIGSTAYISVTDDGPGVPPLERDKIFERFHRGENAEGSGSGLGLPVAMLCARAMGGNLTLAADNPGSGATFVLHLQVATAAREPSQSAD